MENRIEKIAIIIGAGIGLIMAIAGWLAYYLSGAEALLLDGNFSFIGVLATLLALKITSIKTRTSKTYPFGQFVYESAYTLFIGFLTIGVIVAVVAGNTSKIIKYYQGVRYQAIDSSVILIYTITMMIMCFGLALLFWVSNRKLKGNSTILGAYTIQSTIDGFLSAGAGGALILFSIVSPIGPIGFLTQIGDAIVVLVICLLVIYQPVKLIKDSFIELSGGAINNPTITGKIRSVVTSHIQEKEILQLFISKTGSSYLVAAFIKGSFFDSHDSKKLLSIKQKITQALVEHYVHISFELILAEETSDSSKS